MAAKRATWWASSWTSGRRHALASDFGPRAEAVDRQEVTIPFLKAKVPVVVDFENHPAIAAIASWGPELKRKIEQACFKDYRDKVEAIGPESLPKIRRPNEVWRHLEIRHVRIDP